MHFVYLVDYFSGFARPVTQHDPHEFSYEGRIAMHSGFSSIGSVVFADSSQMYLQDGSVASLLSMLFVGYFEISLPFSFSLHFLCVA